MTEIPKNTHETLAAENAQLREENLRLRAENAVFKNKIVGMQEQEASMAAFFRGSQPTIEGRRAHAERTLALNPNPTKK